MSCQMTQDLVSYEIRKYQKSLKFGWTHSQVQSPFQKLDYGSSSKKVRCQGFVVLSSLAGLLYVVLNILSRIVGYLSQTKSVSTK